MKFHAVLIKNLLRRKTRSLLTVIGLAVAVASMVALVGIASGFEQAYYNLYNRMGVDLVVQESGGSQLLNRGISESFGDKVRTMPNVRGVAGGLVDMVNFEDANLFMVVLNGWPEKSSLYDHLTLKSGRFLEPGDGARVIIGRVLAANLGKKVGDKVDLYGEPAEIVGVFESFSVYENGALIMPLVELQKRMDRPKRVTAFLVYATDKSPAAVGKLKAEIEAAAPNVTAETIAAFVSNVSHIKMIRAMAWMTSGIALFIGAIGMLNTMVMAVHERIKEIGTLRAMGWRKARVVQMILGESLMLSLFGAILGSTLAVLMTRYFSHFPATSGFVEGTIGWQFIALGFAMAVVVGVMGAAYPAWWGASLSPIEALRKK